MQEPVDPDHELTKSEIYHAARLIRDTTKWSMSEGQNRLLWHLCKAYLFARHRGENSIRLTIAQKVQFSEIDRRATERAMQLFRDYRIILRAPGPTGGRHPKPYWIEFYAVYIFLLLKGGFPNRIFERKMLKLDRAGLVNCAKKSEGVHPKALPENVFEFVAH